MSESARESSVSALLVGEFETDRLVVHEIFRRRGWRLFEASGRHGALHCLERKPVQVVITETDVPHWDWKKLLSDLHRLVHPPQLIVTSRMADEYLWAEVLNIGGYDVLPRPFERDEVERVVASASRHFTEAREGRRVRHAIPAAGAA